jgi:hypothetical protein
VTKERGNTCKKLGNYKCKRWWGKLGVVGDMAWAIGQSKVFQIKLPFYFIFLECSIWGKVVGNGGLMSIGMGIWDWIHPWC